MKKIQLMLTNNLEIKRFNEEILKPRMICVLIGDFLESINQSNSVNFDSL